MSNPKYKITKSMAERNIKEMASKLDKMDCSKLWLQKMKNLFKVLDLNNTGYITGESFSFFVEAVIKESGMTPEEAKELRDWLFSWLKDTSTTPTDKISFLDFCKEKYVLIIDQELLEDYRSHIEEAEGLMFQVIDTNRDGFISREEWKVLFKLYGITDDEIVNKSFDTLDENKDGLISKEEYLKAAFDYATNQKPSKYDLMCGPLPDVPDLY